MVDIKSNGKAIFIIFIGAIVALTLLANIADQVFDQTNTRTTLNETFTLPAAQNTSVELIGRNLVTVRPNIENVTGDDVTQFFIFDSRLGVGGLVTVAVTSNGTSQVGTELGVSANTTYEYKPDGSAVNNNDSSVIRLITLFAALAITLFVIGVFWSSDSFRNLISSMGRK